MLTNNRLQNCYGYNYCHRHNKDNNSMKGGETMISVAVQRGTYVHVYDEKNRQICSQNGELVGFTSSTFSVKRGTYVYTYDEKGHQISSHPSN